MSSALSVTSAPARSPLASSPKVSSPKLRSLAKKATVLTPDLIQKLARAAIGDVLKDYTFEEKHNKFAAEAQDKSIEWATTFGVVTDPRKIAGFRMECFGIFAANCHPNAKTLEHTRVICDFASVLFALDDHIEPIVDEKDLKRLFDTIDDVCRDPTNSEKSKDAFVRGVGDIIKRMDDLCSPMWKERFRTGFAAHLHSTLWERGNIQQETHPPIKEYMDMRLDTSATPLSFNMIELEKGKYIPEHIFNLPEFQELRKRAANCTNLQNDMISLKKEWIQAQEMKKKREEEGKTGDVVNHNLVALLMKHDIRDVDDVTKLIKALEIAAKKLKENLKAFYSFEVNQEVFGEYTELVQEYLESLKVWTSSYFIWSWKCRRYGGEGFGDS